MNQHTSIKTIGAVVRQAKADGMDDFDIRKKLRIPSGETIRIEDYFEVVHQAEQHDINILEQFIDHDEFLIGAHSVIPRESTILLNSKTFLDAILFFLNTIQCDGVKKYIDYDNNKILLRMMVMDDRLKDSIYIPVGTYLYLKCLVDYYFFDEKDKPQIKMSLRGGKAPSYERYFADRVNADLKLGYTENVLTIYHANLSKDYSLFNERLDSLARKQYATLCVNNNFFLSSKIKKLISDFYHIENKSDIKCDIDFISKKIGMPQWTLQRRLAEENILFTDIHHEVLFEKACALLKNQEVSIEMIGDILGFSSQSSFTRFFKSKSHLTPLKYRKNI